MKTLIILFFSILSLSTNAASMKTLAGDYDVKSPIASGIAHIKEDGTLTAEIYGLVYFTCEGTGAKMEDNIYSVNASCYNIPTVIRIDLSKVTETTKFTAPVYTVIAGNMLMEFTRR